MSCDVGEVTESLENEQSSLEIIQKIYICRFISQGRNVIFKNILRVRCSLRKIK